MAQLTATFFETFADERHVALLEGISGVLELRLRGDARSTSWFLTIRRGDVSVSRAGAAADCVITADEGTFAAIASGEVNALPALLRGLLEVEGDVSLLVAAQALFRPSPGAAGRETAGYARRQS